MRKNMVRKKLKTPAVRIGNARAAASVGPVLLTLRNALQQVERCRTALQAMGYPQKRWQEIVNDVNPELRFALQSQMLDPIIAYLKSVGKPVNRNKLARDLYAQAAGPIQRIRQSITTNLRSGNLTLHYGNKVGLPAWKEQKKKRETNRKSA
jgi:hypothetical protein